MARRLFAPVTALALLVATTTAPTPVAAEMFKWIDETGRMHFTHDLNQVPERFRGAAEAGAIEPSSDRVNTYDAPAAPSPVDRRAGQPAEPAPVYRIRVERAGNSMTAVATVNGLVDVPFIVDTGASEVVLPSWAAERLGLDLENAREGRYGTANGTIVQKKVMLESVELGGARVDGVPAAVSRSMRIGLLGLTFFNHFSYNVDPGAGMITLRRNNLAASGQLRGGRSEEQWKGQFRGLRGMLQAVEKEREKAGFDAERKRRLEAFARKLEKQISALEAEADDARVPYTWRD